MAVDEVTRYRTTFWVTGWNLIIITDNYYYIVDESLKEFKRFDILDWNTDVSIYSIQVFTKSFFS